MKKVYSYSLQGKRETNEDQHENILNIDGENPILNQINFFAVFDGHGGKAVSTYLKKNLSKFFLTKFKKKSIYNDNEITIKYITKVYDFIQNKMIIEHPRFVKSCGSTACVGIQFINSNNKYGLWIINVGDSRAIRCNKYNIAEQLSLDHKPNMISEKNRIEGLNGSIEWDGFEFRINGLSVSRAFGDVDSSPYVTHLPEIYYYDIDINDKFIIFGCDGLYDVLNNQEIVDYINELVHNNFKGNYAKELAEYAYNKGSLDNISIVIYFF
jgi:serine/threonine protein phosphatase PrpC